MTTLEGICNTIMAGDVAMAARDVGGTASVSKCDKDENCKVVAKIPSNRVQDFLCILDERADM